MFFLIVLGEFRCIKPNCGRRYSSKGNLGRHLRFDQSTTSDEPSGNF